MEGDGGIAPGLILAVLAAGASSRMRGGDKLLEPVGGVPLLRRVAGAAAALGRPVLVTLPEGAEERRAALAGLAVRVVVVAEAAEGMAASIRAAAAAAERAEGLMLVLGDMPEIGAAELRAVAAAWDGGSAVRAAAADGTPGQPVIFPRRLFGALGALRGDEGARSVLRGEAVRAVPLPGRRAVTDLDTPEEWAAWRAARARLRR